MLLETHSCPDNMELQLVLNNGGRFAVALYDNDARKYVPFMRLFDNREQADQYFRDQVNKMEAVR